MEHDGAVNAPLLLQAGVGVIPVGAVVDNGVLVGERSARLDRRHGQEGHAVLVLRQQHPVPVDRRRDVHPVVEGDPQGVANGRLYGGRGDAAADRHRLHRLAGEVHRLVGNVEGVLDGLRLDQGRQGGHQQRPEQRLEKCRHGFLVLMQTKPRPQNGTGHYMLAFRAIPLSPPGGPAGSNCLHETIRVAWQSFCPQLSFQATLSNQRQHRILKTLHRSAYSSPPNMPSRKPWAHPCPLRCRSPEI